MQGSAVGRIKASKGHHIAPQPSFDVQHQLEGTQLQLWQQQQQATSAAAPAHAGLGGSLAATTAGGGSHIQMPGQQQQPARSCLGQSAAVRGRAVKQQQRYCPYKAGRWAGRLRLAAGERVEQRPAAVEPSFPHSAAVAAASSSATSTKASKPKMETTDLKRQLKEQTKRVAQ